MERVRERLLRVARSLQAAGIPYAVVGGNAVAAWVARFDEAAVRNTQDVDILLRRGDLDAAREALAREGFVYRHVKGVDLFLDGPDARARDAVHVVFAGEKVRPEYPLAAPGRARIGAGAEFRLLNLESVVAMKLTSFRLKDQVHLQDLAAVGLIDESWLDRFPLELSERLRHLLDNPEA
ncbi:MAG: nucleotidyltransferase family protein [Isosphaeraceae bacterium]